MKRNANRWRLFVATMALLLPVNAATSDEQVSPMTAAKGDVPPNPETVLVTFDELLNIQKPPRMQIRRFPAETYREKHGLLIGTCESVGSPVVGKSIRLTNPVAAFAVYCGEDQPFISPHCILAAGGTRELLLTFEIPITSISIVSDKSSETPDVIRLLIVEPIVTDQRMTALEKNASRQVEVRVLAFDEKKDDANDAPANTLSVDLKGKPFHHVVIECTTEQEGFDDLRFTRAKGSPRDDEGRVSPLFDWAWYARNDGGLDGARVSSTQGRGSHRVAGLESLKNMKDSIALDLTGTNFTDDRFAELKEMKALRSLSLRGTVITDQGLKELRSLTELQTLNLRGSRTGDLGGPNAQTELRKMQELNLRPKISDVGIKELTALTHLESLNLTETQITDVGLEELRELSNLRELALANTAITNAGVKVLQGFEHLRVLDLWGTRVDDSAIDELLKIKSLRHVIVGPSVTHVAIERAHKLRSDCAFSRFGQEYHEIEDFVCDRKLRSNCSFFVFGGQYFSNNGTNADTLTFAEDPIRPGVLESRLQLAKCKVTDSTLTFVSRIRNLVSLDLAETEITDAGLAELKELKSLRELKIRGTRITDQGLASLSGLTELRHLDLQGARFEDFYRPRWAEELRTLQSLGQRPLITSAGLKELRSLTKLEHLVLSDTKIDSTGIAELRELSNLQTLLLENTPISNVAIKELEPLQKLQRLDLLYCNVDDKGLLELAKIKSLKWVRIESPATATGIEQARKLLPNCQFVEGPPKGQRRGEGR